MRLVRYPDPILRKSAQLIGKFDDSLIKLARAMFEVMYRHKGLGLAAPQVGLSERLIVINISGDKDGELSFVNPVILKPIGSQVGEEGCLSFPGIFAKIERPAKIRGRAHNLLGEEVEFEAEGLLARVIAHEIDHLNGVLLVDRMTHADRIESKNALKKLENAFQGKK